MANKAVGLSAKHWKALELIEEGTLSLKDIAKSLGWSTDSLYKLFQGDVRKMGKTAELFYSEVKKINERNTSKIKTLVKDNKKLALLELNDRLRHLRSKKKNTALETKEVTNILNALSKATPQVEIGNNYSLSYTRGLTAEELVYEFQRLRSLAEAATNGETVSSSE